MSECERERVSECVRERERVCTRVSVCVCVCVCLFCYTCEDQLLRRHLFCEDISCCEDILGGPHKNNA